jgi:hypothetical protein
MYPQAQTHTFENTGHVPVITKEKEYIALVKGFLRPAANTRRGR